MNTKLLFTRAALLMVLPFLFVVQTWAANIVIDLDFKVASTYTSSGFPTSETNPKTTSGTYTFGGYSFGFQCATSMYRNSTGSGQNIKYYILIGKSGGAETNASIITFPAISNYKLTQVIITVASSSGENVQAYIGSSYSTTLSGGTTWVFDAGESNTWNVTGTSANTSYKMYIVRKDGTNNTYNGQIAGLKLTYEPAASCSNPDAPSNSSIIS